MFVGATRNVHRPKCGRDAPHSRQLCGWCWKRGARADTRSPPDTSQCFRVCAHEPWHVGRTTVRSGWRRLPRVARSIAAHERMRSAPRQTQMLHLTGLPGERCLLVVFIFAAPKHELPPSLPHVARRGNNRLASGLSRRHRGRDRHGELFPNCAALFQRNGAPRRQHGPVGGARERVPAVRSVGRCAVGARVFHAPRQLLPRHGNCYFGVRVHSANSPASKTRYAERRGSSVSDWLRSRTGTPRRLM